VPAVVRSTQVFAIGEIFMVPIAILESRQGGRVSVNYYSGELKALASDARIDAYIVSTEEGFSPLGSNLRFLASDMDVPEAEMKRLADWNRFANPRVSLVAIQSRKMGSLLRGVILAACESSASYKRFAVPRFGRPHRDFYYNVTYESIRYTSQAWGARHVALSHLSGCNSFHEDIATCNAEALAHYCDSSSHAIDSLTFLSDGVVSLEHLARIRRSDAEGVRGQHRPIFTETEHREGHAIVHLDWSADAQP
jgi:hypothetical protein